MYFFIIFISLISFTCACTRLPQHARAGYKSIHNHIEIMKNSEPWLAGAIGGSFYDGDIKQLAVGFYVPAENFNIDYTRSLMVKGVETFLTSINSNQKLIAHLNHYPFTSSDLNYTLSIYTPDWKWVGEIFLVKGRVCFYKVDEFKELEKIHEEPYSEALQKVNAGLVAPLVPMSSESL